MQDPVEKRVSGSAELFVGVLRVDQFRLDGWDQRSYVLASWKVEG